MSNLSLWRVEDLPPLLPGEDLSFGSGLFVDLVPQSCWFKNPRSCVKHSDWQRIRKMVIERANHQCETCKAVRDASIKRWLEVHERYEYDEESEVQTLRRLVCLCSHCHLATHYGMAQILGFGDESLKHFCKVTGMNETQARQHIAKAFKVWRERSEITWKLDISMFTKAGIPIIKGAQNKIMINNDQQ